MRLAKFLAHAGIASRRRAEDLVRAGRVSVGGITVRDPARDVDEASGVAVDGKPVAGAEPHEIWALNKPQGVVSTAKDTHGRRTVLDLLPEGPEPALPRRPPRRRHHRPHPAHERRRARQPAHAPVVRGPEDLPREGRAAARARGGAAPAAQRHRARGRHDRARARPPPARRRARHHDPRGPQAPGAPHVRRGRPPREGDRAHRVRARCGSGPCRAARPAGSRPPRRSACAGWHDAAAHAPLRPPRRHVDRARRGAPHPRRHDDPARGDPRAQRAHARPTS